MAASFRERISRLTVFSFLWACQALVHHEFYLSWLRQGDWAGWLVAVAALALLLRPGSLGCLTALLVSSVVYNVRKWPFVVNHILMESLIDLTILAAMGAALVSGGGISALRSHAGRERIYRTFAPALRSMMVVMYAFAFLAKLNTDFLNPEVSCAATMYGDLLRRLPFFGSGDGMRQLAIWGTLVIEAALPVLFAFRRTWGLAVLIGLPFHLMLGSVGHRTFSAIAYALYGLFVMDQLVVLVERCRTALRELLGARRLKLVLGILGAAAVLGTAGLIAASATGHYRAGVGALRVYRAAWVIWGIWSLAVSAAYLAARLGWRGARLRAPEAAARAPRWIHALTALVVCNGLTQYLGLKTETCFTMYSNLRTEGGRNNHLFLPALRLAGYQDDLVEVVATDHPRLQRHREQNEWITWFEFRRFTSETREDYWVRYRRNRDEEREFRRLNGAASDPELDRPLPLLARKLLLFRPVSRAEHVPCRH